MSNTSRLVEKLKKKGLVDRAICNDNRRQVDITITEEGIKFLEKISKLIDIEIERLKIIDAKEADELNRILDKLRDAEDIQ